MLFSAQQLSYRDTATFSSIVLDYIEGAAPLRSFYNHAPTNEGLQKAIDAKKSQGINRQTLVAVLKEQYAGKENAVSVIQNIESLQSPNTFTICTAHQPNLFTGPLYFIYKILHVIRLAGELNKKYNNYQFVPVYYMGSEDADKEELNHTFVNGIKKEWNTAQTGAVGRMAINKDVLRLLDEMSGQLLVQPHGAEIIRLLRDCYAIGKTIQQATFDFVHKMFQTHGLVVLIADHGDLKKLMLPIFEDDLFKQVPSQIVEETGARLGAQYNIQAQPRAINLFYLVDGIRNRIVKDETGFSVHDTDIRFSDDQMKMELQDHPTRFSPNVILRGLYQETILPNIAFVGGGGELAYWLQLKNLFEHYAVPFPVLVLRNSFLIIDKNTNALLQKNQIGVDLAFQSSLQIINALLEQKGNLPHLDGHRNQLETTYEDLKKLATAVDATLVQHVASLKVNALRQLRELERKMARAERRKHAALHTQIKRIKETLFPNNNLQERVENVSVFYAKWGPAFIDAVLQHSLLLEQQFVVLTEI